jgi:hypothetical protein
MSKPDPAIVAARELRLLFRSHPDVSLEALAAAMQPAAPSPGPTSDSWNSQISVILTCAAAFGNRQLFPSKQAALRILSEELGIPSHWTDPTWNQMPDIAAAALLRHGPAKAEELMRRYHLPSADAPRPRRRTRSSETVDATIGILRAQHT